MASWLYQYFRSIGALGFAYLYDCSIAFSDFLGYAIRFTAFRLIVQHLTGSLVRTQCILGTSKMISSPISAAD
jgi:hypothetical protein